MKKYFLLVIGLLFVTASPLSADMIELQNGTLMEVVIATEDKYEIVCYSETGKLTLPQ